MTFYEKLQIICNDRGISVSKLCVSVGLNAATGATWKKRGTTPKSETLLKICKKLDVEPFWFGLEEDDFYDGLKSGIPFASEENEKKQVYNVENIREIVEPNIDKQLLAMLESLPSEKIQRVKDFVSGMLA